MIDPVPIDERRPPITPQLALRVAVLGGIAFVLFAIIFFRLWYLQVLSGDQYLQQARDNRVRELRVQAPRGDIVDRNGHVLVENRAATVVQLDPESLPAAERNAAATWGQHVTARSRRPKGKKGPLVAIPPPATRAPRDRASRAWRGCSNMSPKTIQERVVQSLAALPYANVTVKVDVDVPRRNYLVEHPEGFPGIDVERKFLRRYPEHSLAAQLVGSIGEIDDSRAQAQALQGRHAGHGGRPGRPRARLRPVPARRRRLDQDHHRRARAAQELGAGPRPGARALGAHDAGLRSAADRREVPRPDDQPGPGHRGRLRRARPARRQRARARLLSDGQPVDPLQAVLAGHGRSPLRRQRRRAALQPRDRRLLSDGLDLQADHGAGRHEHAASCSPATSSTTTAASRSAPRARRRATPARRRSAR